LASVLVVGKRPCSPDEGNRGLRGHIDSQLGVGCRRSTNTGGSQGYLEMKKTLFLFSFILLDILAGCTHDTHHSNFRTPITLPVETIKSNGSMIHQPFGKDKIDLLEKELENIIMATGAKGISASMGVPDEGIWYCARGITGNPSKEKMTSDLKLFAGSIGKIFTAIVILNLIEEDRLSLESPVEKWFPEMSRASQVTIDQLLTHTSGIASFDNTKEYESHKNLYGNPEELISYLTEKELLFEPGKHFAYSNTGYLMLGIIIERITGRSYEEAAEHYIINKINLQETKVITSETMNDFIVKGHHKGNVLSECENYVVPFAAGSIAATPRDLIVFFQSLKKPICKMVLVLCHNKGYYCDANGGTGK